MDSENSYVDKSISEHGGLVIEQNGLYSRALEMLPIIELKDGPHGKEKLSTDILYEGSYSSYRTPRLADPSEINFDKCVDILNPATAFHFCDFRQLPGISKLGLLSYALRFSEEFKDVNLVNVDQGSFVDRYSLAYDDYLNHSGDIDSATFSKIQTFFDPKLARIGSHQKWINSIIGASGAEEQVKNKASNMSFTQAGKVIQDNARFNAPSTISVFHPYIVNETYHRDKKELISRPGLKTQFLKYPSDSVFVYELPVGNPFKPILVLRDIDLTILRNEAGDRFLDPGGNLDFETTIRDRARPSSIKYLLFLLDEKPWQNNPEDSVLYNTLIAPFEEIDEDYFPDNVEIMQKTFADLNSAGFHNLMEYYKSFNIPVVFSWRLDHTFLPDTGTYFECMDTHLGRKFGLGLKSYVDRSYDIDNNSMAYTPLRDSVEDYKKYLELIKQSDLEKYLEYKKTQNFRIFHLI